MVKARIKRKPAPTPALETPKTPEAAPRPIWLTKKLLEQALSITSRPHRNGKTPGILTFERELGISNHRARELSYYLRNRATGAAEQPLETPTPAQPT